MFAFKKQDSQKKLFLFAHPFSVADWHEKETIF